MQSGCATKLPTAAQIPPRKASSAKASWNGGRAHSLRTTPTPQEKKMNESYKPILCLDFDGVIHSYASGWKGADVIPDPPVAGAIEFIREALKHFRVAIFSSRTNQ